MRRHIMILLACPVMGLTGCDHLGSNDGPWLSRKQTATLRLGEYVPAKSEKDTVGALVAPVQRKTDPFNLLVQASDVNIVFKDEERTGADRRMTPRLRDGLGRLGVLVSARWPGVKLRVTEAWDEDDEHGKSSVHYEGRAADITTSDMDRTKYGELAGLAVKAELDWVYYENPYHVHVSVRREGRGLGR